MRERTPEQIALGFLRQSSERDGRARTLALIVANGVSLAQIGVWLGLSRERVRQIVRIGRSQLDCDYGYTSELTRWAELKEGS